MNSWLRQKTENLIPKLFGVSSQAILTRMTIGAFAVNILGVAIAFGLQILQARVLGSDEYGLYIYVLAWVNLLAIFGKFGLDTSALRFIPEYIVEGKWALLRGFLKRTTQWALVVSILISTILVVVSLVFANLLQSGLREMYFVACILLPANVYLLLQGAYVQAFRKVVISQSIQVIVRPLLIAIAFVMGDVLFKINMTAYLGIWITFLATVISVLILELVIRIIVPKQITLVDCVFREKVWVGAAFSMLLITGFNMALNQTDIIMVGLFLTTKEAGIYSAASKISMFIPFAIILINSIIAPIISQLYAQRKRQQLQRMMSYVAWGSLIFSVPVCAVVIVWGRQILSFYGDDFTVGVMALVILALARLITALTGAVGYLMSMSGHQRQSAYIHGGSALINVVLNAILIPIYGLEGAAVATTISTMGCVVLMVIAAKRATGIDATVFTLGKYGA